MNDVVLHPSDAILCIYTDYTHNTETKWHQRKPPTGLWLMNVSCNSLNRGEKTDWEFDHCWLFLLRVFNRKRRATCLWRNAQRLGSILDYIVVPTICTWLWRAEYFAVSHKALFCRRQRLDVWCSRDLKMAEHFLHWICKICLWCVLKVTWVESVKVAYRQCFGSVTRRNHDEFHSAAKKRNNDPLCAYPLTYNHSCDCTNSCVRLHSCFTPDMSVHCAGKTRFYSKRFDWRVAMLCGS